ncbi:MAG: hypothetical protein A2289_23790 [Deltaproteobacteria bacterium RIFOXYA12_FULL_58_15]|nr:MAG: hypothetical protein A2289_23790 [Deltaproteobacteria bacterium RIFOXYA12_FULL_58_15]
MTFRHQLPPVAAEYAAIFPYDKRKVRHLVGRFHTWLKANALDTSDIDTDLVDEFMQLPWARKLAESTKKLYDRHLYRYVWWLGTRGYARPTKKKTKKAVPALPEAAQLLIQELRTTLSSGSVKFYECALRSWFQWAEVHDIDTRELTRSNVVAYCSVMHSQGLAAQTRSQYLAKLRRYLFYLADEGLLNGNPMKLIRPADFPKPPSLLPRALQPAIDAEIRARLAEASDIRCRGLLLMRHTGLRVGELASLMFDCVHEDHLRNRYLKVPLGKLKNERLVPLSDEALALVFELQGRGRAGRKVLIESPRTKKPFGTTRYHETMRALRDGIETPDGIRITTHRLRHTFATELLSGGISLAAIRQLLGHRSMNMTMRYVSLTPDRLRQDYLAANAKARQRYGKVPEAPPTAQFDDRTAAETIADTVRQIKRDAATLTKTQKARARRAVRELKNLRIVLNDLGL